jgi:hypothetical protein
MSRRQPFTFMLHAIDRYVQRFDTNVSRQEATRRLGDASRSALRSRRHTRTGEEIWICEVLGRRVDCVIKRDGAWGGREGRAVCVTILPEGAGDSYVNEQRVSLPLPTDPSAEALRVAVRYAVASAQRGEERALRVVAEIKRIAPWALAGLEPANDRARDEAGIEEALRRDVSDDEPASSSLNAATGTEEG